MAYRTRFEENDDVAEFVFDSDCGLEIITTYPYERLDRSHLLWDSKKYRARSHPRCHLFEIVKLCKGKDPEENATKEKLMAHFLGECPNLPWVGDLYSIGGLRDFEKAKKHDKNNEIYRHPRDPQNNEIYRHIRNLLDDDKFCCSCHAFLLSQNLLGYQYGKGLRPMLRHRFLRIECDLARARAADSHNLR
ncbi:hypothetical protein Tco_1312387 [Tanacetum coccineum]